MFAEALAQARAFIDRDDHHKWHHRERELPEGRRCGACEALAALDLIEQRAADLTHQLAHVKRHMNSRTEHLGERAEAAEQRAADMETALGPLLAAYEKHLQTGLYEPLGMAAQDFLTALSAREDTQ